jgi:hypothetical protein
MKQVRPSVNVKKLTKWQKQTKPLPTTATNFLEP